MSLLGTNILAQGSDDTSAIFYIIAVLVLSIGGAIFNKIKEKMGEPDDAGKPAVPPRPPANSPPLPRPVIRERPTVAPPTRPGAPVQRPVPRPTPRPMFPADRAPTVPRPVPQRPAAPRPIPPRRPTPPTPAEVRQPAPARPTPPRSVKSAPPAAPIVFVAEDAEGFVKPMVEPQQPLSTPAKALASQTTSAAATLGASIRKLSRDELRRAIVLNEILGPPLALRE